MCIQYIMAMILLIFFHILWSTWLLLAPLKSNNSLDLIIQILTEKSSKCNINIS